MNEGLNKEDSKMLEKYKREAGTALLNIRQELGYTQKDFASKLGISREQYSKYELGKVVIPLEKAFHICKRWNYPIDTIYSTDRVDCRDKFKVDFREILSIDGDYIVLSIPAYYWEYLNEYKKIDDTTDLSDGEKTILHKELEGKYAVEERLEIRKMRLPIAEFSAFIMGIPYAPGDNNITKFDKPSEEEIERVRELFKYFSNPE